MVQVELTFKTLETNTGLVSWTALLEENNGFFFCALILDWMQKA
jgi:hypothetical protein